MIMTIVVIILLVLWILGFVVYQVGSFIHLLLIVALILIIKRLLQERKSLYKSKT